jgi:hypothetical protein
MSVLTITTPQETSGFNYPEFFENGAIVVVSGGGQTIEIHRDGQALAFYDKTEAFGQMTVEPLRTSKEFREAFPDGKIPEVRVEFQMNAWFDLYDGDGNHLDVVGFELDDMIETVMTKFGLGPA